MAQSEKVVAATRARSRWITRLSASADEVQEPLDRNFSPSTVEYIVIGSRLGPVPRSSRCNEITRAVYSCCQLGGRDTYRDTRASVFDQDCFVIENFEARGIIRCVYFGEKFGLVCLEELEFVRLFCNGIRALLPV